MLRAGWKSLLARKLRLFMSGFAVILGVAFVAGSLIFTDTLDQAFTGIMSGAVGDVIVQPAGASGSGGGPGGGTTSATVPARLVSRLAAVDGVARADGNIVNFGTFVVSKKGKLIGGNGAPGIAANHTDGPAAHGVDRATLESGRWPSKSGEVALDANTASRAGYLLGEDVNLVSAGSQPRIRARLVGTVKFAGGLVGASVSVFDTTTAQRLFLEGKDEFSDVWLTAKPGVDQNDIAAAARPLLSKDLEAITGDKAADEAATDIQQALGFITTFLLVFAGIALVVGSFLIVNTFSILVTQRSRELALFRALGAARRQVARSVLFEAGVVGLVGSTVGLGLGFLLAIGIKALFARIGLDLTGSSLVFRWRTVAAAYGVGMIVTLVAAYLPARRAGRVPPVAAMRDDIEVGETSLRRRVLFGAVLAVVGAGALALGLFADVSKPLWYVGLGILGVVLGVAMTSPLVGRPVIAVFGVVYRSTFGAVGRMAEQNAVRNPRRTAATASALMIGVTLVSMMAVFGASAKSSVNKAIDEQFAGDFVVSNVIGQGFSQQITKELAAVKGIDQVEPVRYAFVKVNQKPDTSFVIGLNRSALTGVLPVTMLAGSSSGLDGDGMIVESQRAADEGITVGDSVMLAPSATGGKSASYPVTGLYERNDVIGSRYLVGLGGLARLGLPKEDNATYLTVTDGVDRQQVQHDLDAVVADFPLVSVKNQASYADEQREPINRLLYIIYALLGLAIVIAILGIVNTLGLSVIERTREIGLLRAIGLSRRQLRRMLTLESVVIAVLGAALGIVLGIGFGIALQRSLADQGIDVLSIPWANVAVFLGLAVAVGFLAAIWPGRRAARLDILRAVTTE